MPVTTFDWIRPHQIGGPLDLFSKQEIASRLNPGDLVFGSASVICPDCLRGHTFWVALVWAQSGWFAEVSTENSGNVLIPKHLSKEAMDQYVALILSTPEKNRIPIVNP